MNKTAQQELSVIDWGEYSIPELRGFINEIEYEISRQREEKRKELKERIIEIVRSEGLTLSDVFGWQEQKKARKAPRVLPVKYRHPETGATWTGRGKKPRWLSELIEAGKGLEDFAV